MSDMDKPATAPQKRRIVKLTEECGRTLDAVLAVAQQQKGIGHGDLETLTRTEAQMILQALVQLTTTGCDELATARDVLAELVGAALQASGSPDFTEKARMVDEVWGQYDFERLCVMRRGRDVL